MAGDRARFNKVLAVAINPGSYEQEASRTEHSGDPDQPFQAIPITHSNRSDQCGAGVREGAVGCIS
jgi:hypothetical protein